MAGGRRGMERKGGREGGIKRKGERRGEKKGQGLNFRTRVCRIEEGYLCQFHGPHFFLRFLAHLV
jgi:hypothetical protein